MFFIYVNDEKYSIKSFLILSMLMCMVKYIYIFFRDSLIFMKEISFFFWLIRPLLSCCFFYLCKVLVSYRMFYKIFEFFVQAKFWHCQILR